MGFSDRQTNEEIQCNSDSRRSSGTIKPMVNPSSVLMNVSYPHWQLLGSISPESTSSDDSSSIVYNFEQTVKEETSFLDKSLEINNSKGSFESGSEVSPMSQLDDDEENQNPVRTLFQWDSGSSANPQSDQSKKPGLTWAGWNEAIPIKKGTSTQSLKNLEKQQSMPRESSEEILFRRVQSTACLWDNAAGSHWENQLESNATHNHLFLHEPKTVLKRKSPNIMPLPVIDQEKEFVGQHSQGLGGHYQETIWVKKRRFP